MAMAGKEHGWTLEFGEIAKIWRAGCIIRAVFLQSISQAYENNEDLANLLMDPFFAEQINAVHPLKTIHIKHLFEINVGT